MYYRPLSLALFTALSFALISCSSHRNYQETLAKYKDTAAENTEPLGTKIAIGFTGGEAGRNKFIVKNIKVSDDVAIATAIKEVITKPLKERRRVTNFYPHIHAIVLSPEGRILCGALFADGCVEPRSYSQNNGIIFLHSQRSKKTQWSDAPGWKTLLWQMYKQIDLSQASDYQMHAQPAVK